MSNEEKYKFIVLCDVAYIYGIAEAKGTQNISDPSLE